MKQVMDIYYAIFFPEDGGWCVRFPGFESLYTQGDTLEEAQFMAKDALSSMLVVGRKGRDYNEPLAYEEVTAEAREGEVVFPVTADEELMEEYKPKKRVNVMVPADLLTRADKYVKATPGRNRSQLFCEAVEAMIA